MIMTRRTPCFRVDKYLHSLTIVIDDTIDVETIAKQFFQKMKLVGNIHENVQFNVEQTQKNRRRPMLPEKGSPHLKGLYQEKRW